jgi:hypothetical protein
VYVFDIAFKKQSCRFCNIFSLISSSSSSSAPPRTTSNYSALNNRFNRMLPTHSTQQSATYARQAHDSRQHINPSVHNRRQSQSLVPSSITSRPAVASIEITPSSKARVGHQSQLTLAERVQRQPAYLLPSSQSVMPETDLADSHAIGRNFRGASNTIKMRPSMYHHSASLNLLPTNKLTIMATQRRTQQFLHKGSTHMKRNPSQSSAAINIRKPSVPYASATVIYSELKEHDSLPVAFE